MKRWKPPISSTPTAKQDGSSSTVNKRLPGPGVKVSKSTRTERKHRPASPEIRMGGVYPDDDDYDPVGDAAEEWQEYLQGRCYPDDETPDPYEDPDFVLRAKFGWGLPVGRARRSELEATPLWRHRSSTDEREDDEE